MKDIQAQLQKEGYAVLEDFLRPEEVEELKACGEELTTNLPPEHQRMTFKNLTSDKEYREYFLDSAHKISYFFESETLEDDGKLKVHPRIALNKVGHALHWLHPTFRRITFDERVKEVAFQLNFQEPAICQSMYIYKNPRIGSAAIYHQDATYIHTDPVKLVGFWIALDDATLENGCLWMAPGSHKSGIHRRYIRNKDIGSPEFLIYDRPEPCYAASSFRPIPVRKGSCILIDGQVVHYSRENKTEKSRNAYTFHICETKHATFSKDNWLQPPPGGFPLLYRH